MSSGLRSPSSQSSDVHSTDTPRTKELKELRHKRLAYFDTLSPSSSNDKKNVSSPRPPTHPKATKSGHESPKGHSSKKKIDTSPSASSPRIRRAMYRHRSVSANSDERSPRSQHSSLERVQTRTDSKHNLIDLHLDITPRARLGSASSSQDLRLDTPKHAGSSRSGALRDSFGSLFSDIGSDFTDVTSTDVLLSERFADEPCSVIKRKRDSSRSKNSTNRVSGSQQTNSSPKQLKPKHAVQENSGHSEFYGNGKDMRRSSDYRPSGHSSPKQQWENHRQSQVSQEHCQNGSFSNGRGVQVNGSQNKSLDLDRVPKGDEKGVVQSGSGSSISDVYSDDKTAENICLENVSLESHSNRSGHNTSGHTSLWAESDKSTGQRTLSHENLLDELTNGKSSPNSYNPPPSDPITLNLVDQAGGERWLTGVYRQSRDLDDPFNDGKKPGVYDNLLSEQAEEKGLSVAAKQGMFPDNPTIDKSLKNSSSGARNQGVESYDFGRNAFSAEGAPNSVNGMEFDYLLSNDETPHHFNTSQRGGFGALDEPQPEQPENTRENHQHVPCHDMVTQSTKSVLEGRPPLAVNAQSRQFVTSSNGFVERDDNNKDWEKKSKRTSQSLDQDGFNLANLSAVLGEDRLKRLLMNFKESEDYSDIQSEATNVSKARGGENVDLTMAALENVNIWASLDMSEAESGHIQVTEGEVSQLNKKDKLDLKNADRTFMDSVERQQNISHNYSQNESNLRESHTLSGSKNALMDSTADYTFPRLDNFEEEASVVEELGLRTHRPEEEEHSNKVPVFASRDKTWHANHTENDPCTVKYSYSVEQIYARANTLPYSGEQSLESSPRIVTRLDVTLAKGQKTNDNIAQKLPNMDQKAPKLAALDEFDVSQELNVTAKLNGSKPPRGSVAKSYHGNQEQRSSSLERKLAWSVDETAATASHSKKDDEHGQGDADIHRHGHTAKKKLKPENHVSTEHVNQTTGPYHSTKHPTNHLSGPSHSTTGPSHSNSVPFHSDKHPTNHPTDTANQSSNLDSTSGPSNKRPSPSNKPIPASIERYFQSIEQVSHVSSVCSDTFEPVPEPDIEITPRGPLQVQGKEMHLSGSSNGRAIKDDQSPPGHSSACKTPPQVPSIDTSGAAPSRHDNTPPPIRQEAALEDVSDDQLYNLVQSAISEIDTARSGAITKKLQQLGINFEFLRESYESHKAASLSHRSASGGGAGRVGQSRGEGDCEITQGLAESEPVSKTAASVICPGCSTRNPSTAFTCSACRVALTNKTAPLQSSKSPRMSNHAQTTKSQRTNNARLSKESSGKSSRASDLLHSSLNLNLRSSVNSVDSSANTSVTTKEEGVLFPLNHRVSSKRVQRLRERQAGGDAESSISLDYSEKFDNPRESIPQLLKAELSIDVRRSSDSSVAPSSKGRKIRQSLVQDIQVADNSENNSLQNEALVSAEQDEGQGEAGMYHHSLDEGIEVEGGGDQISEVAVIDSGYHEFLQRLVSDPRLRKRPQPSRSQGRPATSATRRSQYAGVGSKVRSSWDKEQPARRWEKSNLAWSSSNNSRDFSKPPAAASLMTRSVAVNRPSSAGKSRGEGGSPRQQRKPRPQSADLTGRRSLAHHDCGTQQDAHHFEPQNSQRGTGPLLSVQSAVSSKEKSKVRDSKNTRLTNYKKYLALAQGYTGKLYEEDEDVAVIGRYQPSVSYNDAVMMSPRVHSGEVSFMQCLPDEIMLHILSYLKHRDLARCLSVCQHFNRIAADDTLWHTITIRKCQSMTDQSLIEIGKRRPRSLSLIQCHGNKVTAQGLRELFRHCAESLQELNFTGCSRGHLTGDHILLHAAARCSNISRLDTSWCNVNDNGIVAMAEACNRSKGRQWCRGNTRLSPLQLYGPDLHVGKLAIDLMKSWLESLCVNGCQQLSDEALNAVVIKHGIYLHTLELFGCFNLTSRGLASVANHCKSLTSLNLGQCWKLTDTCISNLAPSLSTVENLDLRGCKQMKDQTVHQVVKHCPRLRTLSLANCPNLSDAAMAEIATYCPEIQSLDVCGCKLVTNQGIRSLAHSCHAITFLDLSSTAITSKSVTTIASYSSLYLEVFKVNFCKQITTQCLLKLAKNCKKLQKLFLYGVRGLAPLDEIRRENPILLIETDQNKPV